MIMSCLSDEVVGTASVKSALVGAPSRGHNRLQADCFEGSAQAALRGGKPACNGRCLRRRIGTASAHGRWAWFEQHMAEAADPIDQQRSLLNRLETEGRETQNGRRLLDRFITFVHASRSSFSSLAQLGVLRGSYNR